MASIITNRNVPVCDESRPHKFYSVCRDERDGSIAIVRHAPGYWSGNGGTITLRGKYANPESVADEVFDMGIDRLEAIPWLFYNTQDIEQLVTDRLTHYHREVEYI